MSQIEIKVPAVGESITEVTIGSWVKKDGESVKRDEVICSLDSDKASFEVVSEADGVLHIKAQEGDVLPIGGLICTVEATANGVATPAPAAPGGPIERIAAVPTGIDLAPYRDAPPGTLRDELGLPANAQLVGTVAILRRKKGHAELLEAVPEVLARFPDCHVVFAGDGPQQPNLEARIAELGLGERVHLLGLRRDVPNVLRSLDVFVLPTHCRPPPAHAPSRPSTPESLVHHAPQADRPARRGSAGAGPRGRPRGRPRPRWDR